MDDKAPRPFESSYGISLGTAVLALMPYLILTVAYEFIRTQAGAELGIGRHGLEIISAIATAGYAFGAMLGGDIIQRFRQRRFFF